MYITHIHTLSVSRIKLFCFEMFDWCHFLFFCEFNGIYLLSQKKNVKRSRWNLWINTSTNTDGHYFKMTVGTEIIYLL